MQPVKIVACPHCSAPARFAPDNPWRPFCSERCKIIDLGAWASERYRVPQTQADAAAPAEDESPRD